MWAVNNKTNFKAERTFARDPDGAEIWVVAVRATFSIESNGQVIPASQQEDVCPAPKYFGEPGLTSLRYDMDLVRTKPGTDVVVHAHAYAPDGEPARVVEVGMTVGPISKRLRVVGDRVWRKGWRTSSPSNPEPFVSLPIRYERAWGGQSADGGTRDPFNPVGVGADTTPGKPVPNVEYLDKPPAASPPGSPPAGFGPIPCEWQPRVKLAGTYDETWQRERQPLVPADFQDAYFRCAPADQQVDGFLRGGEEVVLRNLTPSGLLRFNLPRVSLGFRTRIGGNAIHHRGQLHTVIIEPEERRLTLVWQSALPCHHTLYTIQETVIVEKERVQRGERARERAASRKDEEPEFVA